MRDPCGVGCQGSGEQVHPSSGKLVHLIALGKGAESARQESSEAPGKLGRDRPEKPGRSSGKLVHPDVLRKPAVAGRVSVGGLLEHEDVGVVEQSVHRRRRHQVVAEERVPLLERPVAGQDHRPALVARADHLVEVDRLVSLASRDWMPGDPPGWYRCGAMVVLSAARAQALSSATLLWYRP